MRIRKKNTIACMHKGLKQPCHKQLSKVSILHEQVPGMSRRSIPPYSGFPYREDLARLEAEADEREQRQRKDSSGAGGVKEDVAVRKSKAKKKRNRTKSAGKNSGSCLKKKQQRALRYWS